MKKTKAKFKQSDEPSTGLIPLVESLKKVEDSVDRKFQSFELSNEELEEINKYFEEEVEKIHNEFKKPLSTKLPDYAHTIIEKESEKLGTEIHTMYIAYKIFQRRSINNKAKGIFKKERKNQPNYADKITKEELLEIIDEVHNDILKITKQPQQQGKKKSESFNYLGKKEDLKELRSVLINEKMISDIGLKDFKMVFSEISVEEIKPLIWNATPTELIYFIRQLTCKGLIKGNIDRMNYKKIKSCFINKKGKEFDNSFSTINSQIKTAKKNSDFSEVMSVQRVVKIDKIIEELL